MLNIKYILTLILTISVSALIAQTEPLKKVLQDTIPITTEIDQDSSILIDSIALPIPTITSAPKDYKLSKDAIDKKIIYTAVDSNITNIKSKEINLYNEAKVTYEQVNIDGDHIIINFEEHTAKGFAKKNAKGQVTKRANFTDGSTNATYYELAYNFDSEKAFVKNLKTKEGEFNILGTRSKFVKGRDTINTEDQFFNEDAIITTCTLDHPHFGIRTRRMKFIPDKLAVLGPSQLQIAGIPTPLVLPFGFLPLIKGQSSGLIFPSNYEYNDNYGFGLREIGYYFPINDYMDIKVTGDIYTRGSHGIRSRMNYKKRYAYTGNVNVSYNNFLTENAEGTIDSRKTFSLVVAHNQDAKAHPYRKIGGSINISGNQHNRATYNDPASVLNNTYRSSFSYNYNFPDSPFKTSFGLAHSQNTLSNVVSITLPTANLTMRTIQPFKRKDQIGEERWYEKVNLGYGAKLENTTETTDTTILTQETLDNLSSGFSHGADLSYNSKILKYINVSPSISYDEIYYLKGFNRTFDTEFLFDTTIVDTAENILLIDTTFGTIIDESSFNPRAFRKYSAGIAFNTQLFATKRFKKGRLRGIRHIAKPNVSFNFNPDTRIKYEEYVDSDTREEFNDPRAYNPFPTSPFRAGLSDKSMGLNWSINNTLEAKYYSKKDSTEKNLKIFENYTIRGNYDFTRDSMKWSEVALAGNTRIIKGLTTLNFSMNFTPYLLENGTTNINKYLIDEKRFPLQLKNIMGNVSSKITIKELINIATGKENKPANRPNNDKDTKIKPVSNEFPSLTSLIENFRLDHNYRFRVSKTTAGKDTFMVTTHSIALNGNLKLTKNWSITLGNISYDLLAKKFVYPSLAFQRDLHCWKMSFAWYPDNDVYNFFIGVKSSQLSFLKYDYGQNTYGNGFGG